MEFKIGNFQWSSRAGHRRLAALMFVALIALVAGVALMVGIVRMPAPQANRARAGAAVSLNLARLDNNQSDQILNEEAQLFDPAPLFLPTSYNASQIDDAPGARHEPGESLPLIEPRYVYSEGAFAITFPDPYSSPAQLADVLRYGVTPTPYAPFGRLDGPAKPLAARMAQVEVVQMKTGRTVLTLPLATPSAPAAPPAASPDAPPDELPAALVAAHWNDALMAPDWKPLEFLVALDVAGQVGAPALVQSSGSTEVDDFFANYLVQTLRIGAHRELGAGLYLLRIGP